MQLSLGEREREKVREPNTRFAKDQVVGNISGISVLINNANFTDIFADGYTCTQNSLRKR